MQGEDARHSRKAIEHFQKAITLSEARSQELYGVKRPLAWVAYEGLSRCYGDNLGQPLPAQEAMQKAIEALPPLCLKYGVDIYFKARAAYWRLQAGGDLEDARLAARDAYERCQVYTFGTNLPSDHVIMDSLKLYIEIHNWAKDYDSISAVLRDIATRQTLVPGCSLLSCFLRHKFTDQEFKRLTGIIAMTLFRKSDPDLENLLQDSFKRVAYVDTASKPRWNDLRLATRSANFLLRHFRDVTGATKIYTSILSVIDSNDESYLERMRPIRRQAAAFISFCHFTKAVEAKLSKQSRYSQAAERLRSLALLDKRQYRASYSALLYGVWLRDYRQKSPKLWKPLIEPSIKEAIQKLHDDDPWNDDDGYTQLGEALMMGNDRENAAIAFGIAMMDTNEVVIPSGVSGVGNDSDQASAQSTVVDEVAEWRKCASSSQIRRCDGICEPTKDDFAELWCCCLCEKTWFCGDCLRLLRKQDKDADRYVVCSSDHEHLQAYPLSERAKEIVKALRRNDLDPHEQWLREVQTAWNVVA